MSSVPRFLVSIHDVMPETLAQVTSIFNRLAQHDLLPVTLLVIPGRAWSPTHLDGLRSLINRGAELAGHGWNHEVEHVVGLKHRLHSALISKNVAEHLALDSVGRVALMERCFQWFAAQDLPHPSLYVPPAWAMGSLSRAALDALPFEQFETISGVYDAVKRRFHRLPLLGFEAQSRWQGLFVRPWNTVNLFYGSRQQRPIRLGIHPNDFDLGLADQLDGYIQAGGQAQSYRSLG